MSDLLIRGMEMPENCWSCKMFCNCYACEGYACHCAALGKDIGTEAEVPHSKRRDDCPLVPVPPHGRLGDMDAIARKIRRFGDYVDFTKDEIAGWFENGDFETIIPAEEVEA